MSSSLLIIVQLIPVVILIAFLMHQHHLLIALLALEGVTLRLVLALPLALRANYTSLGVLRIIILSIGACEARLGLALLVLLARSYGSDIINNLTINKC